MGRKLPGVSFWRELGPNLTKYHLGDWAEAYLRNKWRLDSSNRFTTIEMGRKLGRVLRPLGERGAGSTSSTMWPGSRPTSVPSAVLIHPDVWPQWTWAENCGVRLCPLFGEGSLVPIYHKVAWAEAYLHTKWHLNPSSDLATTDMGRKLGSCAPLEEGRWVRI